MMREAIAHCDVQIEEMNKRPTSEKPQILEYHPLTFSIPMDDESWCRQHGLKDITDHRRDSYAPIHLAQHLSFINRKVFTWSNFFKVFTIYFLAMCLSHLIPPILPSASSSSSAQLWQRDYIRAFSYSNEQSLTATDERSAWAAGRLGRVSLHSPSAAQSELDLLSVADWNAKIVMADSKADGFVSPAQKKPQAPSRNFNPKMPLPLRQFLSSPGPLMARVRRSYPRRLVDEPGHIAGEFTSAK